MKKLLFAAALALTPLSVLAQDAPATVVDVVTADEDLGTLARALEAAGLLETFSGDGPFTVFAPTDEAFAALPEGELDRLLANPEELRQVLTYHVAGEVVGAEAVAEFADDSTSPYPVETLLGETLNLLPRENMDEPIYINETAQIIEADLPAGNGVVHLIERCSCCKGRRGE
jgi:uncharacterized surface protein with fasciclin (FAS1) repeats